MPSLSLFPGRAMVVRLVSAPQPSAPALCRREARARAIFCWAGASERIKQGVDALPVNLANSIPAIVDCKHIDAWPIVEEVITRLGPHRCLVHSFVKEFKFYCSRMQGEPDVLTEWSSLETLQSLKEKFPSVTTTASAKWLPHDTLLSPGNESLLDQVRSLLKEYSVDTVCLNVPDRTFSDRSMRYFLDYGIIPHIGIDYIDSSELSEMYQGETDRLEWASQGLSELPH